MIDGAAFSFEENIAFTAAPLISVNHMAFRLRLSWGRF